MPRAMKASELGLEPHWKVRVVLPGALIHLASFNEPQPVWSAGQLTAVDADWIAAPDYGDTIGYIDWTAVAAITWRWSP